MNFYEVSLVRSRRRLGYLRDDDARLQPETATILCGFIDRPCALGARRAPPAPDAAQPREEFRAFRARRFGWSPRFGYLGERPRRACSSPRSRRSISSSCDAPASSSPDPTFPSYSLPNARIQIKCLVLSKRKCHIYSFAGAQLSRKMERSEHVIWGTVDFFGFENISKRVGNIKYCSMFE